jgi:hypothetical protein
MVAADDPYIRGERRPLVFSTHHASNDILTTHDMQLQLASSLPTARKLTSPLYLIDRACCHPYGIHVTMPTSQMSPHIIERHLIHTIFSGRISPSEKSQETSSHV